MMSGEEKKPPFLLRRSRFAGTYLEQIIILLGFVGVTVFRPITIVEALQWVAENGAATLTLGFILGILFAYNNQPLMTWIRARLSTAAPSSLAGGNTQTPVKPLPRQTAAQPSMPTPRPVTQRATPVAQPAVRQAAKLSVSENPTHSELYELSKTPEGMEVLQAWLDRHRLGEPYRNGAEGYDPSWFKTPTLPSWYRIT